MTSSENKTAETIGNGCTNQVNEGENQRSESDGQDTQPAEDQGKQLLTNKQPVETGDETSMKIEIVDDEKNYDHGKYKWVVVFSCFIQHFITGGFERSDGVLYLKLINKFNGSAQATAWVGSLSSTTRLCLGPVASMVSNRFSSRVAVIVGGLVMAFGVIISGFAPNLVFLYFSFGLIGGIGRSLSYAPGLVTVGQYFARRPGLAVGLATSGVGAGTFVIPPLFDYLFEEFNFLGAFLILGSIPLNLCVCGALFRPLELHRKIMARKRRKKDLKKNQDQSSSEKNRDLSPNPETSTLLEKSDVDSKMAELRDVAGTADMGPELISTSQKSLTFEYATSVGHGNPTFWTKMFKCCSSQKSKTMNGKTPKLLEISLLKNPPFLLFCISICLFTLSFKSAFTFLPPLAKSRGCTEREAALLMSIAGVADTIVRILSGLILDLNQIRKFRPLIYNFVMFIIAVLLFIAPSLSAFWSLAVICGLFGALTGTYVSQKSVIIVDILGVEKLTSSLGLMIFFQGIGTLIGPPLSGLLKDLFGDFTMAFYFGGGCIIVAGIIMIFCNILLSTQRRKQLLKKDSRKQS